jgi:hypothetical protein
MPTLTRTQASRSAELVVAELRNATLALTLAAARTERAFTHDTWDLPAAKRAISLALPRARWALRHTGATPLTGDTADWHLRAGIARWLDSVETITVATSHSDCEELRRGIRAGQAGSDELLRSAQALQRANQHPPPIRGS